MGVLAEEESITWETKVKEALPKFPHTGGGFTKFHDDHRPVGSPNGHIDVRLLAREPKQHTHCKRGQPHNFEQSRSC